MRSRARLGSESLKSRLSARWTFEGRPRGTCDPGAPRAPEAHPPADKRRELIKDLRLAPAWMHPIFRELAAEDA